MKNYLQISAQSEQDPIEFAHVSSLMYDTEDSEHGRSQFYPFDDAYKLSYEEFLKNWRKVTSNFKNITVDPKRMYQDDTSAWMQYLEQVANNFPEEEGYVVYISDDNYFVEVYIREELDEADEDYNIVNEKRSINESNRKYNWSKRLQEIAGIR